MNNTIDFDTLYASIKLLDRDIRVFVGYDLLHFVPTEVTLAWYRPICEVLAAFGMDKPTPSEARYGFYVHHYRPANMVGAFILPEEKGKTRYGMPRVNDRIRHERFRLSDDYKVLMESVQQLQEWEAIEEKSRSELSFRDRQTVRRWNELGAMAFVKQWRNRIVP